MNPRLPIIAGNWKLNHGPGETRNYFERFLPNLPDQPGHDIILLPPALSVAAAHEAVGSDDRVSLGVQNVHWRKSGAFTGEISAPMARDAGATVALVGHSERRHVFGESIEETVLKTRAVLDAGLDVIFCVGETLEEREAGRAEAVVEEQLDAVIARLNHDDLRHFRVAYEPVWAIGTGRTAAPDDAAEMHAFVRATVARQAANAATDLPILYGGSVKPDNARALLDAPGVDGLLVGGASLDPADFLKICGA